ncbi:hypothetical protein EOL96_02310 [Candidatus Saccharibacteria bacterium]|nr:hypothetical protein [Candidatus Saccharibacteria bacterium]
MNESYPYGSSLENDVTDLQYPSVAKAVRRIKREDWWVLPVLILGTVATVWGLMGPRHLGFIAIPIVTITVVSMLRSGFAVFITFVVAAVAAFVYWMIAWQVL